LYVRFVPMRDEEKHVAVVEIIDGPPEVKGRRVDHKGIPLVIGRSPQVDLVIPNPKISKNHAVIEKRSKHFYLVDLDSKNGTVLNGERILRPEGAKLQHGDDIKVAEIRLKFYLFEGLGDAEIQAIQKRITYNAIQKYSSRSTILFCEIHGFRDLYTRYEVPEVDSIRDKFVEMYRDLVHEGGPYYAEPRGENAMACFETAAGAFEFSKNLMRRVEKFNLVLLRDPEAPIKKVEIIVGIDSGELGLVLGEEGRIENVSGSSITNARAVCQKARPGEMRLTHNAYMDIPEPQRGGIEHIPGDEQSGGTYKYVSDTTAYL